MNRNEAGSHGIEDQIGLRRTRADHVARRYRQRIQRNAIARPEKYASSIGPPSLGAKARYAFPELARLSAQSPEGIAAIDMFVVASASFRLFYVMIILAHDRRKIMRTAVAEHPTAAWLAREVTEAFPWDTTPRCLLVDRDSSYGSDFRSRVEAMSI